MKKTIILCLASMIIGAIAGCFISQNECVEPITGHSYKQLALTRIQMIAAQDALLHRVFHDDPDYWYDVLMETDEYWELDSIREGDWEDFYLY